MGVIDYREKDGDFYRERLQDFLPDRIIDIHAHCCKEEYIADVSEASGRVAGWISLVAKADPIEDLQETYAKLLPDKQVSALIFPIVADGVDVDAANRYVLAVTRKTGYSGLALVRPTDSAESIREKLNLGFLGIKVYLNYAPPYIPVDEIRIFDYLSLKHLEVLDRAGAICMLHIPRKLRLRDPVNLAQMMEIEERFPNVKLIIAHIGRAYAEEDVGNAMECIKKTRQMRFDFSANTNSRVMSMILDTVGPKRVLFGTDLPIFRMRARRIVKDGVYYNIVPKGLYGDLSHEPHMIEDERGDGITFFMYELLDAFRIASQNVGLTRQEIEDVFYNNAFELLHGRKG